MLQELTCTEFRDWIEYSNIEPLASDRADLYAAMNLSLHANINRDSKSPPYSPSDFLINIKKQKMEEPDKPKLAPEEIQAEQMLAVFLQAAAGAQAADQRLGK